MKRVLTIIVLLAFLAVSVFSAPASAVVTEAVLVAGGVMTVGLVAAIVICAAAGGGMNSVINEKAASLGVAPKTFITQKIGEYCQETGMSTPNLLRLFMSGTAISPGNPFDPGTGVATAGNLLLTGSLAIWLTGFFSWLWNGESNEDKLIENGTLDEAYPDILNVNGYYLYKCNPEAYTVNGTVWYLDLNKPLYTITNANTNETTIQYLAFEHQPDKPIYIFRYGSESAEGPFSFCIFTEETYSNRQVYRCNIGESGASIVTSRIYTPKENTGYDYGTAVVTTGSSNWYSYSGYYGSGSQSLPLADVTLSDIYSEDTDTYLENPLVYDPDQLGKPLDRFVVGIGETVKEDTDDPDFPPDVIVGKIPVGDYIEQVAGIYSGTDTSLKVETDEGIVDVPVELTDAGTGVIADAGSIPVVIADEKDVVVADSEQVAEATEDMELDEYTLDLKDFFPFCVPFDIYNMLQLFSDTAEAPNFDWRFYVPGVLDYTLEVDLSDFDPLAEVLRRLELIAFAVALAFATKNIIQGGD